MSTLLLDISILEGIREDKARKNLAEAERFISLDIQAMAGILKKYYPLSVLERAANEQLAVSDCRQAPGKVLLPYILQSILQTKEMRIDTGFSTNTEIRDSDWQKLRQFGEDFTRRLFRLVDMHSLLAVKEGQIPSSMLDGYRNRLLSQILPETLTKEQVEAERRTVRAISRFFPSRVKDVYGVSGEELSKAVLSLIDKEGKGSEVMKARKLAFLQSLEAEVARRRANGENRSEDAIMADLLRNSPDYRRWDSTYDYYMVEFDSNLPRETLELFTLGLGDADEAFSNASLLSTMKPFIGIAGLHYCFVVHHLSYYINRIMISIVERALPNREITDLADEFVNFAATELFGPNNGQYFHYRGRSIEVTTLPFSCKGLYSSPADYRINEETAQDILAHAKDGVTTFFVSFSSCPEPEKIGASGWKVSFPMLLELYDNEEKRKAFFLEVFGPEADDELAEYDSLDEVFDEDEEQRALEADDLSEDMTTDEYEYDEEDDDEKARELDSQYESVEEPEEYAPRHPTPDEVSRLSWQYELPEELLKKQDEELESESSRFDDSFDSDQFESEAEEIQIEKDSENLMEDKETENSFDDLFDDDEESEEEIPEEEADDESDPVSSFFDEDDLESGDEAEPLDEVEEADEEEESGEEDEEDQLTLFDNEGNPSSEAQKKEKEEVKPAPYLFMPGIKRKIEPLEDLAPDVNPVPVDSQSMPEPVFEVIAAVPAPEREEESPLENLSADTAEEPAEELLSDTPEAEECPMEETAVEDLTDEPEESAVEAELPMEEETLGNVLQEESEAEEAPADEESVADEYTPETEESTVVEPEAEAEEVPLYEEPAEEPESVEEAPVADFAFDEEMLEKGPEERKTEPEDDGMLIDLSLGESETEEAPVLVETPVEEPASEEPASEEPAAEEPVAEEPVAEEPVAEEPVAEEPVAEEPVAEEPVAEEPVAEEPVAEEPVAEEPVAEEPVAEEPVAEEPVAEEPAAEEPVAEEPVAEEPVAEEPVAEEPASDEPVAEEPVAEEPASDEPVAEEPASDEPVAEEPASDEPVAEEPASDEPVAEEPVAEEPVAEEPVAEEPVAEEPASEPEKDYPVIIKRILSHSPEGPIASFIKKEEYTVLKGFENAVFACLEQQNRDGKDKIFSIGPYKMSVIIPFQKNCDSLKRSSLLCNAGGVMLSSGAKAWNVLVLKFNADDEIDELEELAIDQSSFTDYDWKIVRVIAQQMEERNRR